MTEEEGTCVLLIQGSCWEFSAGDPAAVVTVYVRDYVYDCIAPAETNEDASVSNSSHTPSSSLEC